MKFAWIAAEKANFPVVALCRNLGVTPSGFYAWRGAAGVRTHREDRRLQGPGPRVVRRPASSGTAARASTTICIERHEQVSRKRVIRLMQEDGLKARTRKRYKHTTMSDHDQPVADNLLDRQFAAEAPNQRWVGDTTEFVIGDQRQALPGGDPGLVLAVRRRLGGQRGERSPPDAQGARDGVEAPVSRDRTAASLRPGLRPTRARTIKTSSPRAASSAA